MIEKDPRIPWRYRNTLGIIISICFLMSIAWVVYETHKTKPEPPAINPDRAINKNLVDSQKVQDRLHQSISGFVENPSPFEEEDAQLRQKLKAQKGKSD